MSIKHFILGIALVCTVTSLTAPAFGSDPAAPQTTLSLIISANDPNHVQEHLKKLAWLKRVRKVKIGSVLLVGESVLQSRQAELPQAQNPEDAKPIPTAYPAKISREAARTAAAGPYYEMLRELEVPRFELVEAQQTINHLRLENSPTWIVRYLGRDYVFEGYRDPTPFFGSNGEFVLLSKEFTGEE